MRILYLCTGLAALLWSTSARSSIPRDVQPLSEDALRAMMTSGPAEWDSVDKGHLGRLLIPRACEFGLRPHRRGTHHSSL